MKEKEYNIEDSPYAVEITDYVEKLLTERPDKRKKSLYKEWLKEINNLANKANTIANYKIYGIFK